MGPRKTVFLLKFERSESAGYYGLLAKRNITTLGFQVGKKNTNQCLGGLRREDQGVQSPQTFPSTVAQTC